MKIPVLFTIFNRKNTAIAAFESIRTYHPERLYVAADGPRPNKEGEKEACEETRQAVMDAIDWTCEVHTLFREDNLGCANAMYGAISWFFEHEEWGIICEDDVVLGQDFYKMCEELLPRYKDNDRVMQITSQYYGPQQEESDTYSFERTPFIWGWATWRRSWVKYMDMTLSLWPSYNPMRMLPLYGGLQTLLMSLTWQKAYKNLDACTSWAIRWHMAAVIHELLCLCPHVNLGLNIGTEEGNGTHYTSPNDDRYKHLIIGRLKFPLQHPAEVCLDRHQVAIDNADYRRIRKIGAKKKILRFLKWQ